MRPRHKAAENAERERARYEELLASMRPRHKAAENLVSPWPEEATVWLLQGGRGIKPRKTTDQVMTAVEVIRLQGGRGIKPRKTEARFSQLPVELRLQGGRGIKPRKTASRCGVVNAVWPGFNEAAA